MTTTPPGPGNDEELPFIGGRVHISEAQTQGTYCLLEASAPQGDEAPRHVHADDDEGFFLLDGVLELQIGGRTVRVEAGEAVLAPRGIPHGWKVVSPGGARWLNTSGGGLERFARDASDPGDRSLEAIAHTHGITFL
jgi:hypothetical protein